MGFQWALSMPTLVFKMNEWGALYFRGSDSQGFEPLFKLLCIEAKG
jgi:hypothetical protein